MIDIIDKIIMIPNDFYKLKNISICYLLKETGYFDVYNKITTEMIEKRLVNYQESIEEWLLYSENKRSSSGYYLTQEDSYYVVGYIDIKIKKNDKKKYKNKIEACSVFIKNEIEGIRTRSNL